MTFKTLMMTAAASALIAGGAIAQDTATTGSDPAATTEMSADAPAMTPAFTSISEMTVGDIVGMKVYDPNGDSIGDIDYVVGAGDTADAVVGIGGFLGLGEYTVALPLNDFTYDADQQMIKLDTTKDALKERPEFDESNAESLPDETALAGLMASNDTAAPAASDDTSTESMSGDAASSDTMGTGDAAVEGEATDTMATEPATEGADTTMSDDTAPAMEEESSESSMTEGTETEGSGDAATSESTGDAAMSEEKKAE